MTVSYKYVVLSATVLLVTACGQSLPSGVNTMNASSQSTTPTPTTTTVDLGTTTTVVTTTPVTTTTTPVVASLSLSVSSSSPAGGTTVTIAASGGTGVYSYSVSTGTLAGTSYTVPLTSQSIQFFVSDSAGTMASATIQVAGVTLVTIYRFWVNQHHYFSPDPNDGYANGWNHDGAAYALAATNVAGTQTLYRCAIRNAATPTFFETLDSNCEGQWPNATLGYIYTSQVPGTVPLVRYVSGDDHLDSVNANDHYNPESTLGYVFPAQ